ncbi:MAG: protein kinase, partial [Pirellulales bacterium]
KVLLSGKTGPFFYDEYVLFDRVTDGPLNGSFRALHPTTRQIVLLRFLDDADPYKEQTWYAAGQHVLTAAQWIGHPNLQDVYQLLELGRKRVVVVADVSGTSLDKILAQHQRLAPHDACRIVRDALLGLNVIHQTGAVHHAVRPANIIVDGTTGVSVLLQPPVARDFLPIPGTVDLSAYSAAQLARQMDYMAPELAHGGMVATPLSDVYAAGCLLYHMLSGRPPYAGGDVGTKFMRHASEPAQPLEMLGVPPQLAQVVLYAMAKDPSIRYQSAAQLVEALTYFVDPRVLQIAPQPVATLQPYLQWLHGRPRIPRALEQAIYGPQQEPEPVTEYGDNYGEALHGSNELAPIAERASGPKAESLIALQEARREAVQKKLLFGILAGVACLIIGFVGYRMATGNATDETEHSPPDIAVKTPTVPTTVTPTKTIATPDPVKPPATPAKTDNEGPEATVSVADDGKALWASPTAVAPLKFAELPTGAQIFFSIRPSDIVNKNRYILKAFEAAGPVAELGRAKVEADLGFTFHELELLQIAWVESPLGLTPVYYAQLKAPTTAEAWLPKIKNPTLATVAGKKVYRGPKLSYYIPPADEGRRVIVAAPQQMDELIDTPARPNSKIERLLNRSDDQRLLNVIFSPAFAENAVRLLPGQEKLFQMIGRALDYDTEALGLSFSLDESSMFFEIKFLPNGQSAAQASRFFADKVKSWSNGVKGYLNELIPNAGVKYGYVQLNDFSSKVAKFAAMTRVDEEQGLVVARTYLNPTAAQHMIVAAELTFAYSGTGAGAPQFAAAVAGGNTAGGTTPVVQNAPQPTGNTVADKLKRTTSLTFARDNLENSMKMLAEDLGVPIEILGGDLQLEGITKNQSFGLEEVNKTAADILQTICKKANPDGKLVYIIKPKTPGGEDMLFITTRAAVAKRGDKLPPELATATPPAKPKK